MSCIVCLIVNGGNESMAQRAVTVMDGQALCRKHLTYPKMSDVLVNAIDLARLDQPRVMR